MIWAEIAEPDFWGDIRGRSDSMALDSEVCHDCDCVVGPVLQSHGYGEAEVERPVWDTCYGNDTNDDLLCEDCYVGMLNAAMSGS